MTGVTYQVDDSSTEVPLSVLERKVDIYRGEQILVVENDDVEVIPFGEHALVRRGKPSMVTGVIDEVVEVLAQPAIATRNGAYERVYGSMLGKWEKSGEVLTLDAEIIWGDRSIRDYFNQFKHDGPHLLAEARNLMGLPPVGDVRRYSKDTFLDRDVLSRTIKELLRAYPSANGKKEAIQERLHELFQYGIRLGMYNKSISRGLSGEFKKWCQRFDHPVPSLRPRQSQN